MNQSVVHHGMKMVVSIVFLALQMAIMINYKTTPLTMTYIKAL